MAHLHELSLNKTQIADAGLLHLVGLTNLRRFVLGSNALTHQGLVHLKGLTQLQRLSLDNTQVQDGGLIHLQPLMHLQNLTLTGTPFSAAGLGHPKTDGAFTRAYIYWVPGFPRQPLENCRKRCRTGTDERREPAVQSASET